MASAEFLSSLTGVNVPQKLRHPTDITAGENVKYQEDNLKRKREYIQHMT
jgi:hypothetical protein